MKFNQQIILLGWLGFILAENLGAINYERVKITVNGQSQMVYDDNITAVQSNKVNDTAAHLTLGIGVLREDEDHFFKLSGNLTQQLFLRNSRFNAIAQDFILDHQYEFSARSRFDAGNYFSYSEEPRSFEESLERRGERYGYTRNRFNARYSLDLLQQLSVESQYRNEVDRLSRSGLANSYLNSGALISRYSFDPYVTLQLAYDYSNRTLETGRNITQNKALLGLKNYLNEKVIVEGSLGVNKTHFIGNEVITTLPFSVSMTGEMHERSRVNVAYLSDQEMNPFNGDLSNFWRSSLLWVHDLSQKMNMSVYGFYGKNDSVTFKVSDRLWGGTLALQYDLNRLLRSSLSYTYTELVSDLNVNARNYAKNRVSLSLGTRF